MNENSIKIVKQTSPYIHKKVSVKRMMLDVVIALIPLCVFAIVQNGFRALLVMAVSAALMIGLDIATTYLMKRKPTINNYLSSLISSLIFALIMPASSSIYVVAIGAISGILLGKMAFGGLGQNIFNPAALGRVVCMVAFGSQIKYVDASTGGTPLAQLINDFNNISTYSLKDLFLGNISGSMGEVCKPLIIVCGLYLFFRCSADFRSTLAMIGSFFLVMLVAGFKTDVNFLEFAAYQLFAGGLIFGAIFMVTDPITSPVTKPGRVWYGLLVGIVSALIRLLGAYPEGVVFAIMICNMLVPVIDYYKWSSNKYTLLKVVSWIVVLGLTCLIVFLAV